MSKNHPKTIYMRREWAELGFAVKDGEEPCYMYIRGYFQQHYYHFGQLRPQSVRYLREKYPLMFGIEKDTRFSVPSMSGWGMGQDGALKTISRIIEEYEQWFNSR